MTNPGPGDDPGPASDQRGGGPFAAWRSSVNDLLRLKHPGFTTRDLNPKVLRKAWADGLTPTQFAAVFGALQLVPSPSAASLPSGKSAAPSAQRPSSDQGNAALGCAILALIAVLVVWAVRSGCGGPSQPSPPPYAQSLAAPLTANGKARIPKKTASEVAKEAKQAKALAAKEAKHQKAMAAQEAKEERDLEARGPMPKPSEWDGLTPEVAAYFKAALRDPDSLQLVGCSEIAKYGKNSWAQSVTYRARNGFGGMNVEKKLFVIRNGEVTKVLDLDQ